MIQILRKYTAIWSTLLIFLFVGCGGGKETNNTTKVVLKSLDLIISKTTLQKDENASLEVMATFADGTSKDVTEKVAWIIIPNDVVVINKIY